MMLRARDPNGPGLAVSAPPAVLRITRLVFPPSTIENHRSSTYEGSLFNGYQCF